MDNESHASVHPETDSMSPQLKNRMYTVTQAAEILHLPVTWFYERTRKDAIPYRKLGKYIRFTESDLAAIIETCSRGPRKNLTANSRRG